MRTRLSIRCLMEAFDFALDESSSFANPVTGEIRTVMHEELRLAEEEGEREMPEWQKDLVRAAKEVLESNDWLALPSKFDIHEWDIMNRFGKSLSGELQTEVQDAIRGSGAFRNFKRTIHLLGIESAWFDFRATAFEDIARRWLAEHDLQPEERAAEQPDVAPVEAEPRRRLRR